ncbi:MAG: hypothetical protein QW782_08385 [Candidatus Bathyarchaeia archaeon]
MKVARINKISEFLERLSPEDILDILHLFRIYYAQHYKHLSNETFLKFKNKLEQLPDSGGIYLVLIVDYLGDAILYIGRTSGKSKTSGLRFRLQDHAKLLGKTPLTIFIPNWWIKKIYAIPLNDKVKAKELEDALWAFLVKNTDNQSQFHSLSELECKIFDLISAHGLPTASMITVELQPDKKLRSPFILKCPPAGYPKNLISAR